MRAIYIINTICHWLSFGPWLALKWIMNREWRKRVRTGSRCFYLDTYSQKNWATVMMVQNGEAFIRHDKIKWPNYTRTHITNLYMV